MRTGVCLAAAVVCVVLACGHGRAQEEEEEYARSGIPLENAIVDRGAAYRLRAEIQTTDDSEDLINEDPAFSRFPTRMVDTELRLFQSDWLSVAGNYSDWDNNQGLDSRSWGWKIRAPVGGGWWGTLRYRQRNANAERDEKNYLYVNMSRLFPNKLYSSTQFNATSERGDVDSYYAYQYLSWRCDTRCRIGVKGLATHTRGASKSVGPWYVQLFTSYYIIPDQTSLLVDARHYESSASLEYQEYNAHLYQRLGSASFVKLSYRYHEDNTDLRSHGYGVKVKHFFSPRLALHAGYRYYDHNVNPELHTVLGGVQLLL